MADDRNKGQQNQGQQQRPTANNSELDAQKAELAKLIEETKALKASLTEQKSTSGNAELEEMRKLHAEMVRLAAIKSEGEAKKDSDVPLAAELPRFKDIIQVPLPAIFKGVAPAGAKEVRIGVQIPHGARRTVQLWMLPGMEAEVTNIAVKAYFKEMGIWTTDHMPQTWVEKMPDDARTFAANNTVTTASVGDAVVNASSDNLKAEMAGMV